MLGTTLPQAVASLPRFLGRGLATGLILAATAACLPAQTATPEPPRPGLDAAHQRVAVADFEAVGADAATARQVAEALRKALRDGALVEVVDSPEARTALLAARPDLVALKPGAARALGDGLGVDAVIYGSLISDVSSLLDDPAPLATPLVQLQVVETLTLEGQLYPAAATPVTRTATLGADLADLTLSLLPAPGRVLSVLSTPGVQEIQLFPHGGRVLAAATEYAVFSPLAYSPLDLGAPELAAALARQDLRPGAPEGRVLTAASAEDHLMPAVATGAQLQVAAGRLVGLPSRASASRPADWTPPALVHSTPAGAVVFCDGVPVGLTPVAVASRGDAPLHLTVALRDHAPSEITVPAATAQGVSTAVALRELPPSGGLEVASTPPGAAVVLDGRNLGVTPLKSENLASGDHQLTVSLEGYKPAEQKVLIRRQRSTQATVTLEKDFKRVAILSEPAGARAWLDDVEVGVTPLDLPAVQSGSRALRLVLPGHAVLQEPLAVSPREAEQTFRFRLRALAGNLRVETTPPGATVTVDGQDRGKSPVALTALGVGPHSVGVSLDGHLPVTRNVEIADQQTVSLQEELQKAEGQIACVSVPAGATITLDGAEMGTTPRTLDHVPAGRRVLLLTLPGYQPWQARVPVVHGQTTQVEVGLLRETQAGP